MQNKPIIKTEKVKSIKITIQYVFRANFNDTYWLEEIMVDLNELRDKQELVWFDPFNGRSKENNTLVAISYASDDEFVILEKTNGVTAEKKIKDAIEYIVCEDYDQSMMIASHAMLWH